MIPEEFIPSPTDDVPTPPQKSMGICTEDEASPNTPDEAIKLKVASSRGPWSKSFLNKAEQTKK